MPELPQFETDPGHKYLLPSFDGELEQVLTFMKREGPGYPGNTDHYPGTNMQAVLRAIYKRMEYLENQIPNDHNQEVMFHLASAILGLEQRAAERHGFDPDCLSLINVITLPMCEACGHVLCHHRNH